MNLYTNRSRTSYIWYDGDAGMMTSKFVNVIHNRNGLTKSQPSDGRHADRLCDVTSHSCCQLSPHGGATSASTENYRSTSVAGDRFTTSCCAVHGPSRPGRPAPYPPSVHQSDDADRILHHHRRRRHAAAAAAATAAARTGSARTQRFIRLRGLNADLLYEPTTIYAWFPSSR